MDIIIGCESSGIVRDAFIAKGHNAISCDLLPTESPGPHIEGDIWGILNRKWDLGIFFTPCTYSCNSGIRWLTNKDGTINSERWGKMEYYAGMLRAALMSNIDEVACENPVPHRHAVKVIGRKYDHTFQPYQFGEDASKRTCLWLKSLPHLQPTSYFPPKIINGRKIWGNQTPSGQNKLGPGPERAKLRSRTYQGVAEAMADQWG